MTTMLFDRPFDAVVGRLVLMYSRDPLSTLRKLIRHLRPGGLVVLQEFDVHGCFSFPSLPLYDTCVRWMIATFERTGADPRPGLKLFSLLLVSGWPWGAGIQSATRVSLTRNEAVESGARRRPP